MNYYKNKTSFISPKMQKAWANKTGAFFYVGGLNFSRGISHGAVMVPSPKIVLKKLPRTYKKLHCKSEPYRFSDILRYRQTDKQTSLLYCKD